MNEHPTREQLATAIGQRVRAARRARALTQEQTAELVGVSSEFFARVERGRALPSMATLLYMAEVLHISPGALLDKAIDVAAQQPERGLPADLEEVLEIARQRPSALRLFLGFIDLCERFERGERG